MAPGTWKLQAVSWKHGSSTGIEAHGQIRDRPASLELMTGAFPVFCTTSLKCRRISFEELKSVTICQLRIRHVTYVGTLTDCFV